MQVAGQPGPFGQGRRLLPGGACRCLPGEQGLGVLAAVLAYRGEGRRNKKQAGGEENGQHRARRIHRLVGLLSGNSSDHRYSGQYGNPARGPQRQAHEGHVTGDESRTVCLQVQPGAAHPHANQRGTASRRSRTRLDKATADSAAVSRSRPRTPAPAGPGGNPLTMTPAPTPMTVTTARGASHPSTSCKGMGHRRRGTARSAVLPGGRCARRPTAPTRASPSAAVVLLLLGSWLWVGSMRSWFEVNMTSGPSSSGSAVRASVPGETTTRSG